ncbi:hypothetical protein BDN72DRAFT_882195 [Pluteus cervinus]|uniref:Uncharacterized protein n=1 Tax=Pluteus cervinus TaxID=181527 RepID=A0ACD3ACF8_9AGAR|nr:hypothetical protein BDN72DRAFT_882195 [Pluteus cervinus]
MTTTSSAVAVGAPSFITPYPTAHSKAQAFNIPVGKGLRTELLLSPLPRTSSRKLKENALSSPFSSRPSSPTKRTLGDTRFNPNIPACHSTSSSPTRQSSLVRRPSEPTNLRPTWTRSVPEPSVSFDRPPSHLGCYPEIDPDFSIDFSQAIKVSTPIFHRNAIDSDSDSSDDDIPSWQTDSLISPPTICRKLAYIPPPELQPAPNTRRTRSGTLVAIQPPAASTRRTRSGTVVGPAHPSQTEINEDSPQTSDATKVTSDSQSTIVDDEDELLLKEPWIEEPLTCAEPPSPEVPRPSFMRPITYGKGGLKWKKRARNLGLWNNRGIEEAAEDLDLEDDELLLRPGENTWE